MSTHRKRAAARVVGRDRGTLQTVIHASPLDVLCCLRLTSALLAIAYAPRPLAGRSHLCTRPSGPGAASAAFSAGGAAYRKVRGYVLAVQYYSMDAFRGGGINDVYVDGVSITFQNGGGRQHIWTYAVAISKHAGASSDYTCPCPWADNPYGPAPPAFVGSNFYCDSGNAVSTSWEEKWYPLELTVKCARPGEYTQTSELPWFEVEYTTMRAAAAHRALSAVPVQTQLGVPRTALLTSLHLVRAPAQVDLGVTTTSDIEVRLMSDQDTGNENVGVTEVKLEVGM